jgi:hypothetical protein
MKYIGSLFSLSLLAITISGSGCNQTSSVKYDGGFEEATITVSPTAYTFPNTALGQMSTAVKFTLINIGFEPTGPVSHVIDGSSEFAITGSTCGQPLAYQGTCDVAVLFRPVTSGQKSGRLTATATPGKTFTVLLSGNSQQDASGRLDPTVYDFFPAVAIPAPGDTNPQMPPVSTPFTVTNTGGTIIGPISPVIDGADAGDFAVASNNCSTLNPMASCTLTVRFKPTTSGPKTASLNVEIPGLKLPSATLSGIGSEAAKITLSPTSQSFGTIPLGMRSAFSFDVTNVGGADTGKIGVSLEGLNISEFTVQPDASCNEALKPNFTCSITVTFVPTLAGAKTASLRVTSSPGGLAKADLTANAMSASTSGMLSVSSPAPDPFGTVAVGESSSGFFVVENKGMVQAGKVMPSISGSNSTEFVVTDNGCPDKLDAGGQCSITVRFTPQLSGRRTANLQVTAFPGGFATLPLSGNAAATVSLLISPTTRNFGSRAVGNQAGTIQEFQVRISGTITTMTGPLTVVVEGADAPNFQIVYNECQNTTLYQSRTSCRVGLRFVPVSMGQKTASLTATATPGGVARATLYGNGT